MKATLTKFFHFSASYADAPKVYGHNYRLGVTVNFLELKAEEELEKKIHTSLIKKLESRDLSLDVDFLKDQRITDLGLLKVFWRIVEKAIAPLALHSLSLERNQKTYVVLSAEKP